MKFRNASPRRLLTDWASTVRTEKPGGLDEKIHLQKSGFCDEIAQCTSMRIQGHTYEQYLIVLLNWESM